VAAVGASCAKAEAAAPRTRVPNNNFIDISPVVNILSGRTCTQPALAVVSFRLSVLSFDGFHCSLTLKLRDSARLETPQSGYDPVTDIEDERKRGLVTEQ
jgi:hypothetical protein